MSYAIIGASDQYCGPADLMPAGAILMQYERPTPRHVAQEDGTWSINPDSAVKQVEVEFASQERELLDSIGRTILSGGATESDALAAMRVAWANLQDAKQAAILSALGV